MIHATLLHHTPATLVLIHGRERCCIACSDFFATRVPTIGSVSLHGLSLVQGAVVLSSLFEALAQLFILEALQLLIVQRHASRIQLLRQRVHSHHVSLCQVVLMLNPILYQVLKLLHLNLHDVLVHVRVTWRDGRRSIHFFVFGFDGLASWRAGLFTLLNALSESVLLADGEIFTI